MGFKIFVREILPGEEGAVLELFKRGLGPIERLFFLLAFRLALRSALKQRGSSLVAICEGRVVGSVSLRILSYAEKRVGIIDAIVADRGFRGRGVGKSLLDGALLWFKERGCEAIHAIVNRYNSPSWNMFNHRGFSTYEFREQFRDLGLNLIRLWFSTFYLVAAGTFLLKKMSREERPREVGEAGHFLTAWLGLTLIWWILAIRAGASLVIIPIILGVAGLSLLAHELAHKLAARCFGLGTTFKAWDSGLLFSSLLAMFFGFFYPAYGSTYIRQVDWRYDSKPREMGLIYTVGPTVNLVLTTLFLALSTLSGNKLLAAIGNAGYTTNLFFVIFNLIPIRPLAWDGGKIFTWNKIVWSLLTIGLALLILTDMLL